MAIDSTPWFVGGGATHSPEVARLLAYAATSGAEGVVEPPSLRVTAQSTPNGTVSVRPGAALIQNRYAGGDQQTYVLRNASATAVEIPPTTSAGGRRDLIVARILDPQYEGATPSDPTNFQYARLERIGGMPSGFTDIRELNLPYPAIALARVDIPASTATITPGMIIDLREVAIPRRETVLRTYAFTGTEGKILGNTTAYPVGSTWAEEAPDAWGPIKIPHWATRVRITVTWAGVGCPSGNANGQVWAQIGLNSNPDRVITQGTKYDTASSGGWTRQVFIAADDRYIPAALRGTEQKIYPRANVNDAVATASRVQLDAASSIILQAEFVESAD